MPAMDGKNTRDEAKAPPVVLSEGAGRALSNAVGRLLKPEKGQPREKRPRSRLGILADNEEVQKESEQAIADRRKDKEAKKARLQFESNAKVIPDAATDAQLEKELLAIATRGAVSLFNAVAKAQKASAEKENEAKRKSSKGAPVSRESFMNMIRTGTANPEPAASRSEDEEESENKAKWLKDDYLTAGSKKLKDWDKPIEKNVGSGEDSDEGSSEESRETNGSRGGESGSSENSADESADNSE